MPSSVIENFVVGIVTSIFTAVAVWLWQKLRKSRILNRKASFFGMVPGERCLAVMNHNPKISDAAMSHSDIQALVEVVSLAQEVGVSLEAFSFDELLEPAGDTTEFCLGGPDSNQRTKAHLENFVQGVRFHSYEPDNIDNIAIITKSEIFRYRKNESEFAVLARFYPYPNSRPVILICGQTAKSNRGAIHYLLQNYDGFLRKRYSNNQRFCLVVKLQSPLTYGYKSARLQKDLTDIAFI
jgi:hypothetical protein